MSAIPLPDPRANDVAACQRKTRYTTADKAALVAVAREAMGEPTLHVYACPVCHRWHLTKMAQAVRP